MSKKKIILFSTLAVVVVVIVVLHFEDCQCSGGANFVDCSFHNLVYFG